MKNLLFLVLASILSLTTKAQKVTIFETEKQATLSNGIIECTFDKKSAQMVSIKKDDSPNLMGSRDNAGAYLMGPGFSMSPSEFKVIQSDKNIVEVQFLHEAKNGYFFELHYALLKGESGVYCFLEQYHHAGSPDGGFGQIRWGVRADENLFDYHLVRDSIRGPMPLMKDFQREIQDWTYVLPDSSIYTKYDYADFIEGRYAYGMAGTKSGYGLFVVHASHEFLNGGPTKQYNTVHATPFMIMMFQCNHFILDEVFGDGAVHGEWRKLAGPFMLYVNKGKTIDDNWADAKAKAEIEKARWPYKWMKHEDYPLDRGTVTGKLIIDGKPASDAHIILAAPGVDWQKQYKQYIYSTRTATDGSFELKNVRPDSFCLYSYATNIPEEFKSENVIVLKNKRTNLNTLNWQTLKNGNTIWQVGTIDRSTSEYKLGNHKRAYGIFNLVPDSLSFTIGQSNEINNWYYAQTKPGSWNIKFDIKQAFSDSCTLILCIVGSAKKPTLKIGINGTEISTLRFGNDASIYRSSIKGGFYQLKKIKFAANLLQQRQNTLSLSLPNVKPGGGIMYDAIRLEGK